MAGRSLAFGTDGVRGRANVELTAEFALELGRAVAHVLDADVAVVGGDSRVSTPMLEAAFTAGLSASGVEVYRLGVAPTPAVAFEASRRDAMGAVVSASHNPFADNGIKVFARGGHKLDDDTQRRIETEIDRLRRDGHGAPSHSDPGEVHGRTDTTHYLEHLLSVLEQRRLDGLRVVVDAANGAASFIARDVFESAGASVSVIHDEPDGRNINAGCGATNPADLQAAVVAQAADIGIALDGDADRLIAVDANGTVVDGDHIIAMCAIDLAARTLLRDDTVVVTVMSNLGFRLAMQQRGINVVETNVGDRYVLQALLEGGYSLGGEQSGHVIFPSHATTGDGMLTALVLMDIVVRAQRPVSELAAESMTRLPQVLINVPVASQMPDVAERFENQIGEAQQRLGSAGRVLVRPSGTEPLVRVMVEAPTHDTATDVASSLADTIADAANADPSS